MIFGLFVNEFWFGFLFVCLFLLLVLFVYFVLLVVVFFWGGSGRDKLNASVALRYHGEGGAGSTHTKMGKFM